jgi:hypothetical protein
LARWLVGLGTAALLLPSACEKKASGDDDDDPTAFESLCNERCSCAPADCPNGEAACVSELEQYRAAGCGDHADAVAECMLDNGQCLDGTWEGTWATACEAASANLGDCLLSPGTCTTENDGVCDNPGGPGTGACPIGTDQLDCMCQCNCQCPDSTVAPVGCNGPDCCIETCSDPFFCNDQPGGYVLDASC